MRIEDFLSVWREQRDAPATDVVGLGTSLAPDAFQLKGGSHVPLACLLR
jgi:hypothetical protein